MAFYNKNFSREFIDNLQHKLR
jgi:hypothetical protein